MEDKARTPLSALFELEMMNSQEVLDFCSAKSNEIDIITWKDIQVMEEEVSNQGIVVVDSAGPCGLNDGHLGCEKDQRTEEVNENGKGNIPSVSYVSYLDISSDPCQEASRCDSIVADPNADFGDMDIGVDLTLNESGVLEPESPSQEGELVVQEGIQDVSVLAAKPLDMCTAAKEPRRALDKEGGRLPSELLAVETTPALSTAEDNERHKHGGKRVTFPSDEDIVSGAVEPKDPWRHGKDSTNPNLLLQGLFGLD